MSLCDSEMNNQVESTNEYPDLEKNMDSIGLLNFFNNCCKLEVTTI